MTDRNIAKRPLTELQKAILDFVWSRGSVTSEQVREAISGRHPLKDSSVRTLLRRLESRGLLRHRIDGQVYVYEAVVPPGRLMARAVQQIIDRFCGGSVEKFLVGMVDEQVLTAGEVERLARRVKKQK